MGVRQGDAGEMCGKEAVGLRQEGAGEMCGEGDGGVRVNMGSTWGQHGVNMGSTWGDEHEPVTDPNWFAGFRVQWSPTSDSCRRPW